MKDLNFYDRNNMRIQDLLACLASTNLRSTTRLLRALPIVLNYMGEKETSKKIERILINSAINENYPAPLHSKPFSLHVEECNRFLDYINSNYDSGFKDNLRDLIDDPYFNINKGEAA